MTKHGRFGSLTYNSWSAMVSRVKGSYTDPINSKYYKDITMHGGWAVFINFLNDMGERPSVDFTLDRIDNNEGYFPYNCRWTDKTTQARNTRDKGKSGVYFRKDRNKWQAQIVINGKNTYLGLFETKEEALLKRKQTEEKYWNE